MERVNGDSAALTGVQGPGMGASLSEYAGGSSGAIGVCAEGKEMPDDDVSIVVTGIVVTPGGRPKGDSGLCIGMARYIVMGCAICGIAGSWGIM